MLPRPTKPIVAGGTRGRVVIGSYVFGAFICGDAALVFAFVSAPDSAGFASSLPERPNPACRLSVSTILLPFMMAAFSAGLTMEFAVSDGFAFSIGACATCLLFVVAG